MKGKIFLALFAAILFVSCGQSGSNATVMISNPVIPGDYPDPTVIRVGDKYYSAGTSSEWAPAYPMYESDDLVNWNFIGPAFKEMPEWTEGSYWAPELFHYKDMYYLFYTARRKSDHQSYIGVASTKDLHEGFTDHGLLIEWTTEAIDAFVIEDEGKLYVSWKAYGLDQGRTIEILCSEFSPETMSITGEVFTLISGNKDDWEIGAIEGQCIVKHDGYFYMLYSGNACCGSRCDYMVGVARAKTLNGKWEKFSGNPILVGDNNWKCPGHGTLVTTPDNRYFYLCHAYNGTDFTFIGRQGVLTELLFDKETGWPYFKYGKNIPAELPSPFGVGQEPLANIYADFVAKDQPDWIWDVKYPEPEQEYTFEGVKITDNSGNDLVGAMLAQNVKRGNYSMTAEVVNDGKNVLKGLCVYGDVKNAVGVGLAGNEVQLWQIKKGEKEIVKRIPVVGNAADVAFRVECTDGRYHTFFWKVGDGDFQPVVETIDGEQLPFWSSAPRIGINVLGAGESATFRSMQIAY